MKQLSLTKLYSVDELANELNLPTKIKNGIRKNFGDPISISDLLQISQNDFFQWDQFGQKSWMQFSNALLPFKPRKSVSLIKKSMDSIIVKIAPSKPFGDVIQELAEIFKKCD